MTDDDRVLITGAGPVGCTAALYLAKQGIPVTLVEACGSLPEDLRASTFHPPTLEMLDGLGIVEALIEQGLICPVWQYRDAKDGIVAEWDLSLLKNDTPHPYRVQAEQFKLTQIIVGVLSGMPEADVRFDVRAVGVTQDASGVDLRVETQDGPAVLRGRYLIGADGASSVVRTSQDIEFPGLTFPELWLCVSTAYDFGRRFEKLAPIAYVADPVSWFVFVKVPGMWRLLMPSLPGETAESLVADEVVQSRMHGVCANDDRYDIVHRTAYMVHQRVADTYRRGRVLLAGDAAHINNPLGGMGMNAGIHDAMNLVEKLTRVWRGEAGDDELDRYVRQRRAIALDYVQSTTLRNKAILEEADPKRRRERQDALRRTSEDPVAAREFLLQSSMIEALERAASLA